MAKRISKLHPVANFRYENWHNDRTPLVLVLGNFTHPNTKNPLTGGINLHYLSESQLRRLHIAAPYILAERGLYNRYWKGRELIPGVFESFYRLYNRNYIYPLEEMWELENAMQLLEDSRTADPETTSPKEVQARAFGHGKVYKNYMAVGHESGVKSHLWGVGLSGGFQEEPVTAGRNARGEILNHDDYPKFSNRVAWGRADHHNKVTSLGYIPGLVQPRRLEYIHKQISKRYGYPVVVYGEKGGPNSKFSLANAQTYPKPRFDEMTGSGSVGGFQGNGWGMNVTPVFSDSLSKTVDTYRDNRYASKKRNRKTQMKIEKAVSELLKTNVTRSFSPNEAGSNGLSLSLSAGRALLRRQGDTPEHLLETGKGVAIVGKRYLALVGENHAMTCIALPGIVPNKKINEAYKWANDLPPEQRAQARALIEGKEGNSEIRDTLSKRFGFDFTKSREDLSESYSTLRDWISEVVATRLDLSKRTSLIESFDLAESNNDLQTVAEIARELTEAAGISMEEAEKLSLGTDVIGIMSDGPSPIQSPSMPSGVEYTAEEFEAVKDDLTAFLVDEVAPELTEEDRNTLVTGFDKHTASQNYSGAIEIAERFARKAKVSPNKMLQMFGDQRNFPGGMYPRSPGKIPFTPNWEAPDDTVGEVEELEEARQGSVHKAYKKVWTHHARGGVITGYAGPQKAGLYSREHGIAKTLDDAKAGNFFHHAPASQVYLGDPPRGTREESIEVEEEELIDSEDVGEKKPDARGRRFANGGGVPHFRRHVGATDGIQDAGETTVAEAGNGHRYKVGDKVTFKESKYIPALSGKIGPTYVGTIKHVHHNSTHAYTVHFPHPSPSGHATVSNHLHVRAHEDELKSAGKNEREEIDERNEPVDHDAARELELYIHHLSEPLYKMHRSIRVNMNVKKAKGTYDAEKAVTGFHHLTDRAADDYAREFGGRGQKGYHLFNKFTRHAVATRLRDAYDAGHKVESIELEPEEEDEIIDIEDPTFGMKVENRWAGNFSVYHPETNEVIGVLQVISNGAKAYGRDESGTNFLSARYGNDAIEDALEVIAFKAGLTRSHNVGEGVAEPESEKNDKLTPEQKKDWAVCPKCKNKGKGMGDCAQCKGRGYIRRSLAPVKEDILILTQGSIVEVALAVHRKDPIQRKALPSPLQEDGAVPFPPFHAPQGSPESAGLQDYHVMQFIDGPSADNWLSQQTGDASHDGNGMVKFRPFQAAQEPVDVPHAALDAGATYQMQVGPDDPNFNDDLMKITPRQQGPMFPRKIPGSTDTQQPNRSSDMAPGMREAKVFDPNSLMEAVMGVSQGRLMEGATQHAVKKVQSRVVEYKPLVVAKPSTKQSSKYPV